MKIPIFEVCPHALNRVLAEHIKTSEILTIPKEVDIIKTGHGKEMPPADSDWYYKRAASIIRKLCINTIGEYKWGVGIPTFASRYGCRKNRGSRPSKMVNGATGHVRKIMHDFERCNWVIKVEKGRKLTEEALNVIGQLIEKVK
jgi:small subunit ribosomal protein S19e